MYLVRNIAILALLALFGQGANAATTILPSGKTCFLGVNGAYSSGSLNMYIPNTTTPKSTYQDPLQATLNTQPIQLDVNGCAIIYGVGSYRQQLYDGPVVGGVTTGNQIWDQLTADTSAYNSAFWAALSGGTPNAITVTDSGFNNTDGSVINFLALNTNTGATTISVSSGTPISVVKDTSTGPVALSGGEIVTSNIVSATYDATHVLFHLAAAQSVVAQAAIPPPQGYLNLAGQASGDVVQTGDVTAATTVYYSPYVGNQIPIYNGASFVIRTFSELTLTLTAAAQTSSTIYDVCAFNNAGVTTLVTGPAWANSSAGAGSRGTGAGTAQISRINGTWVNSNSITGVNGTNSYSIPADQCTYVGSIFIDATAGQVSAYKTYGQSRKWGIWNAYNRQQIYMIAGDSTATWSYTTNATRAANGNSANSLTIFTGLPEESFDLYTTAFVGGTAGSTQSAGGQIGIGYNSTTSGSGKLGDTAFTNGSGSAGITFNNSIIANYKAPPTIGINVITALENGLGVTGATWNGTQAYMLLSAAYRG
jgi:hypothetical protein